MAVKITDEFYLFYHGSFSQWHPTVFTFHGEKFCCAEQAMMAGKAILFNDLESHSEIMATNDPRKHKALGRKVQNFSPITWRMYCRQLVYEVNFCKFNQNPDLKAELLSTGNRIIAEASPRDKRWGIGLGVNNPLSLDMNRWQGTNWLGECLMLVRDDLL